MTTISQNCNLEIEAASSLNICKYHSFERNYYYNKLYSKNTTMVLLLELLTQQYGKAWTETIAEFDLTISKRNKIENQKIKLQQQLHFDVWQ